MKVTTFYVGGFHAFCGYTRERDYLTIFFSWFIIFCVINIARCPETVEDTEPLHSKRKGEYIMLLKKVTEMDYKFVNELFILSNRNNNQGYAFPRGDIEDVENELNEYGKCIKDCFYIIEKDLNLIGIIGFLEVEEDRGIIIGPVMYENFYTYDNVSQSIKLLLNMDVCKYERVSCNILNDNQIVASVLLQNNFTKSSTHVTMRLQLDEGLIKIDNDFNQIVTINLDNKCYLNEIDLLFKDTLSDWIDESVESLYDYIDEGYQIAVIAIHEKIIGSIIWVWFEELGYGRIEYLAVQKKDQGKGYGRLLIDYVISELSRSINHELNNYFYIDLNIENKNAYKLYKKMFEVQYIDSVYRLNRPIY